MTLYEALQDIGKGRIIDNGCDFELIALAKGCYTFTLADESTIEIITDGRQGENARNLEKEYYSKVSSVYRNSIIKVEYTRK